MSDFYFGFNMNARDIENILSGLNLRERCTIFT